LHPLMQKKVKSVVIENDRKNEMHKSVKPAANYESLSPDDLLNIIHEKGIVGMGGAMFPTYVKLKPKKRVDTLIVNGVECEPYLTADYRVMLERSKDIIDGIKIVAKILGVDKAIIAIEDNKKEAVGKFMDLAVELPTKYPQGAEKMLIKKVLGREVPPGGLPMDVGVVVSNVSTILAISDAVIKGIPLYKRVITVSGVTAPRPGNYEVKIGTPLQNIVNYCFSNYSSLFTVHCLLKMGGPMMGIPQADLSAPVIKGTTGLVAVKKSEIEYTSARNCIKCGRCVDVCPMELYPLYFAMYSSRDNLKELCNYNVKQCIECGCCEYICSSKIPLVGLAKKAKQLC
ncbi:MAG: electron transport complex subunit RsxC, partial [Elusimicrobiota bacterium]